MVDLDISRFFSLSSSAHTDCRQGPGSRELMLVAYHMHRSRAPAIYYHLIIGINKSIIFITNNSTIFIISTKGINALFILRV